MEKKIEYNDNSLVKTENMALTPAGLLEMAVNHNADLDKLERLIALQERWEAKNAEKAYIKAMAEFKKNAPDIIKNKGAGFQGKTGGSVKYNYATLFNVVANITTALSNHGFSHAWKTEQKEGIKVICTITHIEGHSESTELTAGADTTGAKNSIQAIGSTISYLERYTLLAATGLATADMDDDAGYINPETKKEIASKQTSAQKAMQESRIPSKPKPVRPWKPDVLKMMLEKKAKSLNLSKNILKTTLPKLCIASDKFCRHEDQEQKDWQRKTLLKHLTGKESRKDLTEAEAIAFMAWIDYDFEHGVPEDWGPDMTAVVEARLVYKLYQAEK